MTLAEAIRLVVRARTDTELFGADEPTRRYRRLAAVLHPDRVGAADSAAQAAAADAFVKLTTRWNARNRRAIGQYRIGAAAYAGDIADLYDVGVDRLLKLPRDAAHNDLMDREARALETLAERGDPRYLPYVPRIVATFVHRGPAPGADRRVNVLGAVPGLHSLAEVRRERPLGLDPRDAAWMWRRLLVALGLSHRAGVVHGAVLPEHVLIRPADHGLVLVDWCYAVSDDHGGTIPALVTAYRDWYPAEVIARRPPGPGTDLAMAARCMTYVMGDRIPHALRRFADGCALPALRARPDDAWRLLGELDEVLERLFGPRTFRPFTL